MPKGKAPHPKKETKWSRDYVGRTDGSSDAWMTRRATDKGGNIKKMLVPNSSKPSEANDYHEMFNRKARDKKIKGVGPKSRSLKRKKK